MAKTVLELVQQLERKSAEYQEFLDAHKGDKVDENNRPIFDMDAAQVAESVKRNDELNEIGKQLDSARATEAWLINQGRIADLKQIERNVAPAVNKPQTSYEAYSQREQAGSVKLGETIVNSNEYKFRATGSKKFSVELEAIDMKTLMTTSAGFAPPNNRGPIVIPSAQRRPMVSDLIPQDSTTNSIIKFMEETTFTNSAAGVLEGGLKPESALAFTERTSIVQKIATWIPVTEEQVDDVPQLRGLIDNRLMLMLGLIEETEILTGNGTSPHLDGFLHRSGVQTQAKGSDDSQDAIFKAFTLVRFTGYAEPSGIVMHPNDWQDIRLLRTTDGIYIFGDPSVQGEARLWGKPVIVTSAITENTALVGDFTMYSHISRRMGVRIDVADQHDTYFIYNKLAVRIEERLSLEIYRAAAFATVTSI